MEKAAGGGVRVVVTGHKDGRGVVVSDELVPPSPTRAAGYMFHLLWGTDELPTYPDDGRRTTYAQIMPKQGQIRLAHLLVQPDDAIVPGEHISAGDHNVDGVHTSGDRDPSMHFTPTIDLQTVIKGEVWVQLDDGVEVHLRAGDSMVQQGTWHAWRNRGAETAHVIAAVIGVTHHGFEDRG